MCQEDTQAICLLGPLRTGLPERPEIVRLDTQVEFDFGSGRIIFGRIMPSDVVLFKLFSAMLCTLHLCILVLGNS